MSFDIVALGELLIDFIPCGKTDTGMDIFARNPGGAPGNVLVAASRLGLKTSFIGKVGNDIHGQYLKNVLNKEQVDIEGLSIDNDAFTTLAFVSLSETGERNFSFARKPGADTRLEIDDIPINMLEDCTIFHFGSLSLTDSPSKESTLYAVKMAKKLGKIISYDPNYRPPLWKSYEQAQKEMCSVIKYADLVKISEEEIEIITGEASIEAAVDNLICQGVSCVVITLGKDGAFLKNKP